MLPLFVVGEYVLNSGANQDTNIVWVNPATASFGGATPPASGNHVWTMNDFTMSDLGGLVFIDRVGNGASGGVGNQLHCQSDHRQHLELRHRRAGVHQPAAREHHDRTGRECYPSPAGPPPQARA